MDRLSDHLQLSGVSPRSSSRSLVPMRRLNTIEEARQHTPSTGVDVLDERGPGSLLGSSLRGRRAPVPAPRRRSSDREDEDNIDSTEETEPVNPPPLPPPGGWAPENQDARENGAGNPLLRHSSQGSRGSRRL